MNRALVLIGIGASALIGFLLGKKGLPLPPGLIPGDVADATLFRADQGSDGFCQAEVLKKRMRGRAFHWHRVGSCRPAPGGYFEIRVKNRTSPLIPANPQGVNDIWADVHDWAEPGDVYYYSLWQVLADGRERELEDPELEIGQI